MTSQNDPLPDPMHAIDPKPDLSEDLAGTQQVRAAGVADELDPTANTPAESGRRSCILHCFHCNRDESFFMASKYRWYHSYLVGFTFGLIAILGPYRCKCCGNKRYFRANWLHPLWWLFTRKR